MRFSQDSFSQKRGQEEEERIRWNQLALFRLWLRRFPKRLHGGRDERRESSPEVTDELRLEIASFQFEANTRIA